jgi:hypothetical protein
MKLKALFLISVSVTFNQFQAVKAQPDLRNDSAFFNSKFGQIDYWLENTGISQLFIFKDFEIKKDRLTAIFDSRYSSADSTFAALYKLNNSLDPSEKNYIEKSLFNYLTFELELGKDSLEIELGANLKSSFIPVSYKKEEGIVANYDKILKKFRTFKPIIIETEDMAIPAGSSVTVVESLSIKDIRKTISDFLKEYYSNKGTFFYDAQLDVLKENSNELTFEVSKLSKEILPDRNYFEFIRIEIKIMKTEKAIEIRYQIQGKYSGGFGFAPRRSEYRNMEPDYSDYLQLYEEKIAQKISQLLTR